MVINPKNRDSMIWATGFIMSVALYAASHTALIPEKYASQVRDVATVFGFASGKLGWSPLSSSLSEEKEENK